MAKNTHSQEVLTGTSDSYTEHEFNDPNIPINRPMLGEIDKEGEEETLPSKVEDGTDSSASSESESNSESKLNQPLQSPAQMTANHSPEELTEDSTADSTGGVGQETEQNPSPRKLAKKTPAKKASSRTVANDDFDEFE